MPHDVIATCPVCTSELSVTRLRCGDCGTTIEGEFAVGRFGRLTREQMQVLESFLRSRGNLRDMERELGISYPTVRARVEALVRSLGFGPRDEAEGAAAASAAAATRRRRGSRSGSPRDPRATVPPRAERRGGRRGHPRHGKERPMTDTTRLAPSARDLPLEPGGEVTILLTSNGVRLRGVDGDRVTVRTRDGADIDDEVVMDAGPGQRRGSGMPSAASASDRSACGRTGARTSTSRSRRPRGSRSGRCPATSTRWTSGPRAAGPARRATCGSSWAAAATTVDSMSGDVTIEATGAIALRARSVSGDLRIRAPRIDDLGATTTSGDIRVEADLAAASEHQVSSVSGDVELVTPSPVRIETQTIAGDVRASGTHTAEGGRGRRTHRRGRRVRPGLRPHHVGRHPPARPGRARSCSDPPPRTCRSAHCTEPPAGTRAAAAAAPTSPPVAPEPPEPAPDATYVVAEAEAAPNLVRPPAAPGEPASAPATGADTADHDVEPAAASAPGPWLGAESTIDRREAARLDILRALERGELDIDAASHRLEQLEDAGPRYFRGWC